MKTGIDRRNRVNAALFAISIATIGGFAIAGSANAQAVIDNGIIQLGINPFGNLITDDNIGLTFLPATGSGEALAPGCACEGWGIADMGNPASGFGRSQSNGNTGTGTATLTFSGTGSDPLSLGSSAVSTSTISVGGNPFAEVVHAFAPSASTNLYEVDVTITNLGGVAFTNLVYRRAMDWDVPPTEFREFVTIQGWPATALIGSSDDGFVNPNPLSEPLASISSAPVNANFSDNGPDDHGAAFDFSFGALAAGGTENFSIFYGAASNIDEALAALAAVRAEVYSFGYPSVTIPNPTGAPNVFIFAFAGVGGTPLGPMIGPKSDFELIRAMGTFVASRILDDPLLRMDGLINGGEMPGKAPTFIGGLKYIASGGFAGVDLTLPSGIGADMSFGHGSLSVEHAFQPGENVKAARLGAGLDFGRVSGSHEQDTSGSANTVTLYGYGGLSLENGIYADAVLGYTWLDYDWSRLEALGGMNGDTDGGQFSALFRAGIDRPLDIAGLNGMVSGGLFASALFTSNSVDGFTESSAVLPGGNTYGDFGSSSVVTRLGGRLTSQMQTASGMPVVVQGSLAWEHQQTGSDTIEVNGAPVDMDGVDRDLARVGFRLAAQVSPSATISADYDGGFGDDYTENAITARFKVTF